MNSTIRFITFTFNISRPTWSQFANRKRFIINVKVFDLVDCNSRVPYFYLFFHSFFELSFLFLAGLRAREIIEPMDTLPDIHIYQSFNYTYQILFLFFLVFLNFLDCSTCSVKLNTTKTNINVFIVIYILMINKQYFKNSKSLVHELSFPRVHNVFRIQ